MQVAMVFGIALAVHSGIIYLCAVHLSPWLVGRWFAWLLPSSGISAGDWYLRHLELVSIVPALAIGYLNVPRFVTAAVFVQLRDRFGSASLWGWVVPTAVLAYKVSQYQSPSSVLIGDSMSAMRYYFDIKTSMPTMSNLAFSDPVRVLQQMLVTAPFYAGIGYSVGALGHNFNISLLRFFTGSRAEAAQ